MNKKSPDYELELEAYEELKEYLFEELVEAIEKYDFHYRVIYAITDACRLLHPRNRNLFIKYCTTKANRKELIDTRFLNQLIKRMQKEERNPYWSPEYDDFDRVIYNCHEDEN